VKQRWMPIAVLAVGLFAINVIARLVIRLGFDGEDTVENRVSIVMFAVIGVALAVITFIRAQQKRPSEWLPELTAAAVLGMLLTILIGPFVSGQGPFESGAGNFFLQVWLYAGFAIVGTLLGYWIATALGVDHRSKLLRAYAERKVTRPRRVVRR
jgi:phosphotransferase system  glucose/maltose/N-acetylglucosamine-specific IIC component